MMRQTLRTLVLLHISTSYPRKLTMTMNMKVITFVKWMPMIFTHYADLQLIMNCYLLNLILSSSGTVASQLKIQKLFTKPAEVAEVLHLDVCTILLEKLKDPVLSAVRSRLRAGFSLDTRAPEIRQSKGLIRHCQEIYRLFIEEHRQFLCYD